MGVEKESQLGCHCLSYRLPESHIVGGVKTIFLLLQEVETEGCYRLAVIACDLLLR